MLKRILIPVSHPLGGIRTYLLYNLSRLCREGYQFTFLSTADQTFDLFKNDVADWEGTEFVEVPAEKRGSYGMIQAIRQTLSKKGFALIHSQGLRAGTEAGVANFFRQIPHLMTLHDVIVPGNDLLGRFKFLKKRLISTATKYATVIIPVSHDCAANHLEHFPAWRRGPVRIETICNGVDVERLLQSQKQFEQSRLNGSVPLLRNELGLSDDVVLGGFFGRFMPQKGFDILHGALLLLAKQGLQDRFCVIATIDKNGYTNETIRSVTNDPIVSQMVRFIEPVTDIVPVMSQVDVLLMPSRWEAFSLLVEEAMVLGIPVIGSDCLGLREVLVQTPSYMPPKENPGALAAAIADFIANREQKKQTASEYAIAAQHRFDVNIATEQLLTLYTECLRLLD
ncbi:MAG: glycosyltransferase family 4 protein [Planctomycetaceae bacterium]|nr:glycosyltransferase family 4 protein [Planctomycetaceae bacterium]